MRSRAVSSSTGGERRVRGSLPGMARSSGLLAAVLDLFRPSTRPSRSTPRTTRPTAPIAPTTGPPAGGTVEVDPRSLGRVVLRWEPAADGVPDPGEIVWTWVPYEENDGRGKDRPVLVIASGRDGTLLGVQLTSKDHDGDRDHVSVGSGDWDGAHRESWARLDRVFRLDVRSVRREASSLPRTAWTAAARALASRYGWTVS